MRYEFKYYLPMTQLTALRAALSTYLQHDPHARDRPHHQYTVHSVYFDTPQWSMYHQKDQGVAFRDKVRVRAYNDRHPAASTFLEIKRKYQQPTRKFRHHIPFAQLPATLLANHATTAAAPFAGCPRDLSRFLYQLRSRQLLPLLLINYEREAFLGVHDPDNQLRVTFDTRVRARAFPALGELFSDEGMQACVSSYAILEVKFNRSFPGWLSPLLGRWGLRRQAISKYALCVEALRLAERYARPAQVRARVNRAPFPFLPSSDSDCARSGPRSGPRPDLQPPPSAGTPSPAPSPKPKAT